MDSPVPDLPPPRIARKADHGSTSLFAGGAGIAIIGSLALSLCILGCGKSDRNSSSDPAAQATSASAPGLVAYYPLDKDTLDQSGNGHHGENFGTIPDRNRLGQAGRARRFNGTNAFIAISNAPGLMLSNAVTVTAWVLFEPGGNSSPRIVYKGSFQLATGGTNVSRRVHFWVNPGEVVSPLQQAETWMFLAGTYDGTHASTYVNGQLAGTQLCPGGMKPRPVALNLGRNSENGLDVFKGLIDEVRIYNRALNAAEIRELYHRAD